jgi:hypothetical protein
MFHTFDVVLTVHCRYYVEIKCQLDATDEFLLQILLLAQHGLGTFMPIIRSCRVLYKWLLSVVTPDDGHKGAQNMLSKQ